MKKIARAVLVVVINANASFKMHGWGSNSKEVNRNLSKLGIDSASRSFEKSSDEKNVGLQWDTNLYRFSFSVRVNKIFDSADVLKFLNCCAIPKWTEKV